MPTMIKLINNDILKVDFSEIHPINLIVTSPVYNVGINYNTYSDTMIYAEYLEWSEKWIAKCFSIQPISGRICINVPFTTTPVHLKKEKEADYLNYSLATDITKICQSAGYKYHGNGKTKVYQLFQVKNFLLI
jgi:site-specific DNA-methyltransferase (adenine-specific)